jgi:hypothetical protein
MTRTMETIGTDLMRASVAALGIAIFLLGCAQTAVPAASSSQQSGIQNPGSAASSALHPPSDPSPGPGASAGQFEQVPVVGIGEFLPLNMQSGNGYYLAQQVPTNGAMGQYTIIASADVFGSNAGTYQIESLDLLKIRLSEIPAIAALMNVRNTSVFIKEVAASAARPLEDATLVRTAR